MRYLLLLYQVAIGLSLTIMLVMYTMYQGVSQTLPKTGTMKFIDWWLLFCVIMPFLVFMTEIMWEHNHIRRKSMPVKKSRKCWPEQPIDTDKPVDAPFQRPIHILFITFTMAFVFGYAALAANYYNNNSIDLTNYDGYD